MSELNTGVCCAPRVLVELKMVKWILKHPGTLVQAAAAGLGYASSSHSLVCKGGIEVWPLSVIFSFYFLCSTAASFLGI